MKFSLKISVIKVKKGNTESVSITAFELSHKYFSMNTLWVKVTKATEFSQDMSLRKIQLCGYIQILITSQVFGFLCNATEAGRLS